MMRSFDKYPYEDLDKKEREDFNYFDFAALLSEYGFVSMRVQNDWRGADFLAQHIEGNAIIRVQLKGGIAFHKHYIGKRLGIAFREEGVWYLYPHDVMLGRFIEERDIIVDAADWQPDDGEYTKTTIPEYAKGKKEAEDPWFEKYIVGGDSFSVHESLLVGGDDYDELSETLRREAPENARSGEAK